MTAFNAATDAADKLSYNQLKNKPDISGVDVSGRALVNLGNVVSDLTSAEQLAFQVKVGLSPTVAEFVTNNDDTRLQWDGRANRFRKHTLTKDYILNAISFPLEGAVYASIFTQDATGGHEVTYTNSFYDLGSQDGTLSTDANAINLLTWFYFADRARLLSNVVIS